MDACDLNNVFVGHCLAMAVHRDNSKGTNDYDTTFASCLYCHDSDWSVVTADGTRIYGSKLCGKGGATAGFEVDYQMGFEMAQNDTVLRLDHRRPAYRAWTRMAIPPEQPAPANASPSGTCGA